MCHGKRAATALLIALFFTGCDGQSESTQDLESVGVGATPLAVSTVLLDLTELTEPIFVTGTILPLKSTDIAPLVGGLIDEIYVRVGDRVEKGEQLFRMRQKDLEIKLSRLVNAERLAEAEFTDAKRDLENAVALRKKDAFSVEQLDDRQTRVEVTNARRGIARANLAEAQKELDDSTTLAPYRGVITGGAWTKGHIFHPLCARRGLSSRFRKSISWWPYYTYPRSIYNPSSWVPLVEFTFQA